MTPKVPTFDLTAEIDAVEAEASFAIAAAERTAAAAEDRHANLLRQHADRQHDLAAARTALRRAQLTIAAVRAAAADLERTMFANIPLAAAATDWDLNDEFRRCAVDRAERVRRFRGEIEQLLADPALTSGEITSPEQLAALPDGAIIYSPSNNGMAGQITQWSNGIDTEARVHWTEGTSQDLTDVELPVHHLPTPATTSPQSESCPFDGPAEPCPDCATPTLPDRSSR